MADKVQDTRISADEFGMSVPAIGYDDLEEDVAVLTVKSAEKMKFDDGRVSVVVRFEETGDDMVFYARAKVDVNPLIEKLGGDLKKWPGQKVPMEKVKRSYKGETHKKVGVVPAEDWDQYLKPSRRRR